MSTRSVGIQHNSDPPRPPTGWVSQRRIEVGNDGLLISRVKAIAARSNIGLEVLHPSSQFTSQYFAFIVFCSVLIFALTLVSLLREPAEDLVSLTGDFLQQQGLPSGEAARPPDPLRDLRRQPASSLDHADGLPPHCAVVFAKTKRPKPTRPNVTAVSPPWERLVNMTVPGTQLSVNGSNTTGGGGVGSKVYVYVWAAQTRRLGNQLFNYASLFGIAWRNGNRIPLWPDAKTQVRTTFYPRLPIDERNAIVKSNQSRFVKLREPGWAIYGPKTEHLDPHSNYSLTVFLQSWKYFLHVEDQLRLDLTFREPVLDRARRLMETWTPPDWKGKDYVRVIIHVRRGDYNTPGQQKFGWAQPEPDYFNRSMSYYESCFERVQFIVLSNDIAWCQRNIVGRRVVYSTGRRSPTDDMALASLCDHAIVTIGSYGWWAGWFADGVTVTQRNFPTPKSPLLKRLSREDYYKPDWVAL